MLRYYGITDTIHGWIKNFLENRSQYVAVGNQVSEQSKVTSGIPQGSVLGPLLFVVYINDFPTRLKSNVYIFADDTKVFTKKTGKQWEKELDGDLRELEKWSETWLLNFNPSKCVHMRLTRRPNEPIPEKCLMDNKLKQRVKLPIVEAKKDLGVTVHNKLNFREHIGNCIKKANKMVGIIRRCFTNLNRDIFNPLFTALARSHLEYAQSVWSPITKEDMISG